MTRRSFSRAGVAGALATGAVALAGCAGAEPGAAKFVREHAASLAPAAAAVRRAEAQAAGLHAPLRGAQKASLEHAAALARRSVVGVSEWSVAEKGQEENLEQAEREVTEGAARLVTAMSALQVYGATPSPASLARYSSERARGREQWNQGIGQLWYLAHRADPPTI